ncbi:hypothetical protein NEF87_000146 [Candidatus Lokiarchaeum ossiferum]|uniref:Uncharacterized protein n=1 Tax=Candidatus Lokiarchaeum ossiferum TaxID=2951803 RepID=A0ABY6HMR9_9ARCH|nr:hypothetical protein NEF87_000146 [Candidatus Lokiarchaeum sp. B-35]
MSSSKNSFALDDYPFVLSNAHLHFMQGKISQHQWVRIRGLCEAKVKTSSAKKNS